MINHLHSRFPCCPKFEFYSRYHSFCDNFSQWKVSPGRKNRVSGASCDENRIAFFFSASRGKHHFQISSGIYVEAGLYWPYYIFALSLQMRSCLFCLDPLFYAHLFPVDKKVSIKINDEMRADSQRDRELDIDQVKCFFYCIFIFILKPNQKVLE